jgi:anti-sigma B factor antagonist
MSIAESEPASTLDVQVAVSGGRHTLVLSGELDLASAPELLVLVVHFCRDRAREIVIDLSKLRFMDSAGLNAILMSQRECRDQGAGFLLTPPVGAVRRVFEMSGMLDELPFVG